MCGPVEKEQMVRALVDRLLAIQPVYRLADCFDVPASVAARLMAEGIVLQRETEFLP